MVKHRLIAVAVVLLGLLAWTSTAQSQRGRGVAPSRGPGWLPRISYFDSPASDRITAAELSVMLARHLELERILLQVPELARPAGFEIEPVMSRGNRVAGTGTLLGSMYWLMFYNPTKQIAGEGCGCIEIRINSTLGGLKSPYEDERGEIYLEEEPGPPVNGATHVWGDLSETERGKVIVMFTSGRRSPWKSVTRENFLKAVITQAEGKNGEKLAEARQAAATSPYQQWLAEAPTRKAQREATIAAMDPSQRAELRKALEDAERETTRELKAADEGARAGNTSLMGAFTEYGDGLRARIAAMSAEERNMPALLDRMDTSGAWNFVGPGAPNAQRVLQLDRDFFRPRGSLVEARTVSLSISISGTGYTPEVRPALLAAFRKIDWSALARLLEKP
jgi:hypothetical protein